MSTFIGIYLKIIYILLKGTAISGNNKMTWHMIKWILLAKSFPQVHIHPFYSFVVEFLCALIHTAVITIQSRGSWSSRRQSLDQDGWPRIEEYANNAGVNPASSLPCASCLVLPCFMAKEYVLNLSFSPVPCLLVFLDSGKCLDWVGLVTVEIIISLDDWGASITPTLGIHLSFPDNSPLTF